jgi:hypothetical protein
MAEGVDMPLKLKFGSVVEELQHRGEGIDGCGGSGIDPDDEVVDAGADEGADLFGEPVRA